MPSNNTVRITTVGEIEKTSKAGKNLQYVQITGYCHDTKKGFKKQFFATTQDGKATKMAEQAYGFSKGDWVNITMDDSSFKNVTQILAADQPADFDESMTQGGGGNSGGGGGYQKKSYGGGGKNQMSKEEWAAKDAKKEASIARSVALKEAVNLMGVVGVKKGDNNVDRALSIAKEFVLFLTNTSETAEPASPPANNRPADQTPAGDPGPGDDDIPF